MTSMAYFLANDSLSAFFAFLKLFWGKYVHRTVFTEASHWAVDKNLTLMLIMHLAHFCHS